MKIQKLYLKNFGKFTGKQISLEDGINIIYGENESGKSTVHTFIRAMLFGMERGRGRASAKDTFSRLEPWDNPSYYAGEVDFSCGGRHFHLSRSFDKYSKNVSLICTDDGEALSVEEGDLQVLTGGLTESGYQNTVSVGQIGGEPDSSLADDVWDHAASYYAAGDVQISLSDAVELLKTRRKNLEKEVREEDIRREEQKGKAEQELSYVYRDLHRLEQELQETEDRIAVCMEELEGRLEESEMLTPKELHKGKRKWRVHPVEIAGMFVILLLDFLLLKRPWSYMWSIVIILACGLYVWNRLKDGKGDDVDVADPAQEHRERESGVLEKLRWSKERLQQEWKEKKILYSNLEEQMEELDRISDESAAREKKRKALELAESRMQEISEEMQKNFSRNLNKKACSILEQVTGGKYRQLVLDHRLNGHVIYEGRKIEVSQLSKGTAEQIFFALRMAAGSELYEEELPLILDEAFAAYDDERLAGVLNWLTSQSRQVLLFTCHKREIEMLQKRGCHFRIIRL